MNNEKQFTENKEAASIIRETNDALCIKLVSKTLIGKQTYTSYRYEIWNDKEKYNKGIYGAENTIYCRGFATTNENYVLSIFKDLYE